VTVIQGDRVRGKLQHFWDTTRRVGPVDTRGSAAFIALEFGDHRNGPGPRTLKTSNSTAYSIVCRSPRSLQKNLIGAGDATEMQADVRSL